eukprot:CAMPEP_0183293562 /NCGR_PEP_ID=MMETSP0160_2-20130417/2201_1 /TAXON_ID=2839 ORGANISM="Odontella Sinensis, Strain Grunow 1884" /NCGR_SAMPLE_ID=MMETSP0160_2 /ASSEMBLY_ACC=CAM_ASM_000250 /LENGTH=608 /DNA_ID=CAMNT_0025454697 /DNA_START=88 /DNA_END=1914 /DNA_ORIENTATION=-
MRSLAVALFLLDPAGATPSVDFPCTVCQDGAEPSDPSSVLRFLDGHMTCAEADAYARMGCMDPSHCGFIQGFAKDTCCGGGDSGPAPPEYSEGSSSPGTDLPPRNDGPPLGPTGDCDDAPFEGSEICFDTVREGSIAPGIGVVCINDLFGVLCSASLNGRECDFCAGVGERDFQCNGQGGYDLRCGTMSVRVCGERVTVLDFTRGRGGGGSGGDDDFDPVAAAVAFAFAAAVVCGRLIVDSRSVSQQRPVRFTRIRNNVEMVAVPEATVVQIATGAADGASIPTARAVPLGRATGRQPNATGMDLIAQDPFAKQIYEQGQEGKLDSYCEGIEEYRGNSMWDLRAKYATIVAESLISSADWEALVACHRAGSQDCVAAAVRLVEGEYMVNRAWQERGSGFSHTVSESMAQAFKQCLCQARDAFLDASALDPQDPSPYACLQKVALGLSGRTAGEGWLRECESRHQYNYKALTTHQYMLMAKWHGTRPRESLDYARKLTTQCPADHPIRIVMIKAFYYQALDAAWTKSDRMKLIREPWVKTTTLDIFQKVYANNPEPPLDTLVEKEQFQMLIRWLLFLVENRVIAREVLTEAAAVPAQPRGSQQVVGELA